MGLLTDIAKFLTDAGLVAGSSGWAVAKGHMPDDGTQHKVVCIYPSGGTAPDGKGYLEYPGFQVRVRSTPNAYSEAEAKIAAIQSAITPDDGASPFPATINGTSYRHMEAEQSEPISLGKDERGRFHLVQNFLAWRSR